MAHLTVRVVRGLEVYSVVLVGDLQGLVPLARRAVQAVEQVVPLAADVPARYVASSRARSTGH